MNFSKFREALIRTAKFSSSQIREVDRVYQETKGHRLSPGDVFTSSAGVRLLVYSRQVGLMLVSLKQFSCNGPDSGYALKRVFDSYGSVSKYLCDKGYTYVGNISIYLQDISDHGDTDPLDEYCSDW